MNAPKMQTEQAFNIWHLLWTFMLTFVAGLLKWNLNQLTQSIEQKADKAEVASVSAALEALRLDRKERDDRSEEMHRENRQRLDRILEMMSNPGGRRRT